VLRWRLLARRRYRLLLLCVSPAPGWLLEGFRRCFRSQRRGNQSHSVDKDGFLGTLSLLIPGLESVAQGSESLSSWRPHFRQGQGAEQRAVPAFGRLPMSAVAHRDWRLPVLSFPSGKRVPRLGYAGCVQPASLLLGSWPQLAEPLNFQPRWKRPFF